MADVSALPELVGYNLSAPRKGASVAAITDDEYKAPIIAFWQKKRAAAAVFAAEVDGPLSGGLPTWSEAPRLFVNLVRTLAASVSRASGKAYSENRRGNAEIRIELGDQAAAEARTRNLEVRLLPPEGGEPLTAPLRWIEPNIAAATVPLPYEGDWLPVVDLGDGILKAPPVSLPYSPEFLPQGNRDGEETLRGLAAATGGKPLAHTDDIFEDMQTRHSRTTLDLSPWIILALLLLLLLEIAERRLLLFQLFSKNRR